MSGLLSKRVETLTVLHTDQMQVLCRLTVQIQTQANEETQAVILRKAHRERDSTFCMHFPLVCLEELHSRVENLPV